MSRTRASKNLFCRFPDMESASRQNPFSPGSLVASTFLNLGVYTDPYNIFLVVFFEGTLGFIPTFPTQHQQVSFGDPVFFATASYPLVIFFKGTPGVISHISLQSTSIARAFWPHFSGRGAKSSAEDLTSAAYESVAPRERRLKQQLLAKRAGRIGMAGDYFRLLRGMWLWVKTNRAILG